LEKMYARIQYFINFFIVYMVVEVFAFVKYLYICACVCIHVSCDRPVAIVYYFSDHLTSSRGLQRVEGFTGTVVCIMYTSLESVTCLVDISLHGLKMTA